MREIENPSSRAQAEQVVTRHRITFAVDSVTPAEKPIWSETFEESLVRRFQEKVLVSPQEQVRVTNLVVDGPIGLPGPRMGSGGCVKTHSFLHAVHTAFSQHRPLTLTPDTLWLLIAQGFSHHVAANAESLRPMLVRHKDKKDLRVPAVDLSPATLQQVIATFSSLIREETNPVLYESLICDFSTTTPVIRTASEAVLMDTYSSYFNFMMLCVCGIPEITLTGTVEDWLRIRARIEVLATYDLEWWVARLRPILDEFLCAVEGRANRTFWQAIYKPRRAYGDTIATGWITDLFPYLGHAPEWRRSHVFNHERRDWSLAVEQGLETDPNAFSPVVKEGVGFGSIPAGLSNVRINVILPNGSSTPVNLVAGFLGVTQNPTSLALTPHLSWCLTELPPERPPAPNPRFPLTSSLA